MPAGYVHRRVTIPLAVSSTIIISAISGPTIGLPFGVGVAATLAVHPDLDILDSAWRSKRRRMGLPILWWLLWLPYARSLRHRSPLSHWPLVSTAFRLFYIAIPAAALALSLWLAGIRFPVDLAWGEVVAVACPLVAGMAVSDFFHWLLDTVT